MSDMAELVRDARRMQRLGRALLLLGVALAALAIALVIRNLVRGEPAPEVVVRRTVCGLVATPSVDRCPPEDDRVVIGIWDDGTMATMRWQEGAWGLHVRAYTYAPARIAPHDWRELDDWP